MSTDTESELYAARTRALKEISLTLPTVSTMVLQHMEVLMYEAAVNKSEGDHSLIVGNYRTALRDETAMQKALSEAGRVHAARIPTAMSPKRCRGRSRPHSSVDESVESSTPTWGDIVAQAKWTILGSLSLWITYDIGKLYLVHVFPPQAR